MAGSSPVGGQTGGYVLSRSPEKITLYDIVKLIEGELLNSAEPPTASPAPGATVWHEVRAALEVSARATRWICWCPAGPVTCTTSEAADHKTTRLRTKRRPPVPKSLEFGSIGSMGLLSRGPVVPLLPQSSFDRLDAAAQ